MADVSIAVRIFGRDEGATTLANSVASSLSNIERAVTGPQRALDGLWRTMQTGIGLATGMTVFSGIQAGFSALGEAAFGVGQKLENAQVGFTTMLHSGEKASVFLQELARFAARTPFAFPELVQASQRLLAMGVKAESIIPLITDIGDASAAMGKFSAAAIDRMTLAIGQMQARTKVSHDEMRQLTEIGIPAWNILAEAVGKPIPVVQELTEKGAIASEVFINAFHQFARNNWGDMMKRMETTFTGALSTMRDNFQLFIAQGAGPAFDAIKAGMVGIATWTKTGSFDEWGRASADAMRAVLSGMSSMISFLSPLSEAIANAFSFLTQGNFAAAFDSMVSGFQMSMSQLVANVVSFGKDMFGAGFDLIVTFGQGMLSGLSYAVEVAASVAASIAEFFIGHSPIAEGPLSEMAQGGQDAMQQWGEGAKRGVESTVVPAADAVRTVFKGLERDAQLIDFKTAFQNASGNMKALESVGRDVESRIREISRATNDLDFEMSSLRFTIDEIKSSYEAMLEPIEKRMREIRGQRNLDRDQRRISLDLEEAELNRAENAAKGNREKRAALQADLESTRAQIKDLQLAEQEEEARSSMSKNKKNDDKDDAQHRLAINELRRREAAIQREILAQQDRGQLANIAGRKAEINLQQEELRNEERIDKLKQEQELAPLEAEQRRIREEMEKQLEPLQAQLKEQEKQHKQLSLNRQAFQGINSEINDALQLLRQMATEQKKAEAEAKRTAEAPEKAARKAEAASRKAIADAKRAAKERAAAEREAFKGQFGPGMVQSTLPTMDLEKMVEDAKKKAAEAGPSIAAGMADGFRAWWASNAPSVIGNAILGSVGMIAFGPIGALVGVMFSQALQAEFANRGIDFSGFVARLSTDIGSLAGTLRQSFTALFQGDVVGAWNALWTQTGIVSVADADTGQFIDFSYSMPSVIARFTEWLKSTVVAGWNALWTGTAIVSVGDADTGQFIDMSVATPGLVGRFTAWLTTAWQGINWSAIFGTTVIKNEDDPLAAFKATDLTSNAQAWIGNAWALIDWNAIWGQTGNIVEGLRARIAETDWNLAGYQMALALIEAFKGAFGDKSVMSGVGDAVNQGMTTIDWIALGRESAWAGVQFASGFVSELFPAVLGFIKDHPLEAAAATAALFPVLGKLFAPIKAVVSKLPIAGPMIEGLLEAMKSGIGGLLKGGLGFLKEIGGLFLTSLKDAMFGKGGVSSFLPTITTWFKNIGPTVANGARNIAIDLGDAIGRHGPKQVVDALKGVTRAFDGFVDETTKFLKSSGLGFILGMWGGIAGATAVFGKNIADWVNDNIIGAFKKLLNMSSPSKVAEDIGSDFIAGLWNGISSQAGTFWNSLTGWLLTNIFTPTQTTWTNITNNIPISWAGILSALQLAWTTITTSISSWLGLTGGAGAVPGAAAGIVGFISQAWMLITTGIPTAWQGITNALSLAWTTITGLLTTWLGLGGQKEGEQGQATGFTGMVASAWAAINAAIPAAWALIQGSLGVAWAAIASAAMTVLFGGGGGEGGGQAFAGIVPSFAAAWAGISDGIDKVLKPAIDVAVKLFDTMREAAGNLIDKIGGLIDKIKDLAKEKLPDWIVGRSPPPLARWIDYVAAAAGRAAGAMGEFAAEAGGQLGAIGGSLGGAIDWGMSQIGKRYAGPVIGEPDNYRWGNPGYDCSSFVSSVFRKLGINLSPFTDAAASQTVRVTNPQPGDIVFYRYADASQPGVTYPHMGIYMGDNKMLDAQYPMGVGIHPLLTKGTMEFRRPPALSSANTESRALGGWIDEPVVGTGLHSGRRWTFGERGPEYVIPGSGGELVDEIRALRRDLRDHPTVVQVDGERLLNVVRRRGVSNADRNGGHWGVS